MLTDNGLDQILKALPRLRVGVLGDLFLDRYLDLDASLTEKSIETGLDAYQVTAVRPSPGAAGTVINNLVAFGIERVSALSVIGDDGDGYELLWALKNYEIVDSRAVFSAAGWKTPTYVKPMLREKGKLPRELNRFDTKNYQPLSSKTEDLLVRGLDRVWPRLDALLVLDQVTSPAHGVVTPRIVKRLAEFGETFPEKPILADSRGRIEMFRSVWLKPNRDECLLAFRQIAPQNGTLLNLAKHAGRPVLCTSGDEGIVVADPRQSPPSLTTVPAYPVNGPIDIVGAGDSASAAIACALAAGVSVLEAAAFGNLVASITIQQLGTTGVATPAQIKARWQEVKP